MFLSIRFSVCHILYCLVLQRSHYELGSKNGIAYTRNSLLFKHLRDKKEAITLVPKMKRRRTWSTHKVHSDIKNFFFFFLFLIRDGRTATSKRERSEGVGSSS